MIDKKIKIIVIIEIFLLMLFSNIFMYSLGNNYKNITNIIKPTITLNKNNIGNREGIYLNPFLLFKKDLKTKEQERFKKFLLFSNLGIICFIFLYKKEELDYYGTAKFASTSEIKSMNILDPSDGVILGLTQDDKLISHNGVEHLMVMAPTRSGKGVGCVLPTLWTWKSSIIVNDIKGECWDLTSGYRRSVLGQKCIFFNPMDDSGEGISYNPLALVKVGTGSEQEDSRLIATTLIDIDGKGESDHWISSAINLLTAVILHVKYVNVNATFLDVMKFLTDPEEPLINKMGKVLAKKLNDYGETEDDPKYTPINHYEELRKQIKINLNFMELYNENTTLHPVVGSTFSSLMNTPDKERGSIISSCVNKLKIFGDPRIMKNVCRTDITPKDIMKNRISLYLITPPRAIDMTRPLFRLIITQTIFELTDKMEFGNRKKLDFEKKTLFQSNKEKIKKFFYKKKKPISKTKEQNKRILFLIDEFPALGNLGFLEKALAYIAGYGLKVLLITQAISQLNKTYGKDNSIIANCHGQLYYTPNDSETPKLISDMLGTKTIKIKTKSVTKGSTTYSENYQSRALMTAGEVRTLPYEETLLLITGRNPIHGKKLFWFNHDKFKNNVNYNIPYKSYLELLDNIERAGFNEYVLEYLIYKKNGYKALKIIIDGLGKEEFLKEILQISSEKLKEIEKFKTSSDDEKLKLKRNYILKVLTNAYGSKKAKVELEEYLKDCTDEDYIKGIIVPDRKALEKMLDINLENAENRLSQAEQIISHILGVLKKNNKENQLPDSALPNISLNIGNYLCEFLNEKYSFNDLKNDIEEIFSIKNDYDKFITLLLDYKSLEKTKVEFLSMKKNQEEANYENNRIITEKEEEFENL